MDLRRRFALLAVTVAATPLALGGCTAEERSADRPAQGRAAPPELTVTPTDRTRNVPLSAEVGTAVRGGRVTAVRFTDDRGAEVRGEPREDGSSWVPAAPLKPERTYTAEVTATGDSGATTTRRTTFTTMPAPTKPAVTSTLYFAGNRTYGTAMPVTVAFDPPIPKEARDDVQRRLFVKTDPPQPGAWSWVSDGSQVYYRAPDFWRPGTTITVRAGLAGLPIGKDQVGDDDRTATSKIGRQVALEIDNASKQMSVVRDGKVVRRIPVSLGKPSTPTSSGKMVIMEKHQQTTFDTRGSADPYVVDVEDAQRLTWGGEFIHGAPWSEGDQGSTNVSHGCTNVSAAAADWLMGVTQVGDLVTVKGTEVELTEGNGWTAWNVSWDQFVKGSALPVPSGLRPSPTTPAHPGAVAGGSPAPAPSVSGG
ncbi:L,D-transpeptidase [Micromonospora endolithica]|uniref:L,D-transpeptidase n=1 Tax=Micromonospora endolithica TaxID=230091 RepID=A0A3A9YX80_9ACTN|nr:Ig-like domain-containing protein [Micromonospora endolithica]RKN40633.1 L,D-transpeptidase [Micromonospora endolithica]TWJ21720.1 L,D-transpeptidase-like protein [Micromonospora endolithica]